MRFLVRFIPRDPDRVSIISTVRSIATNLGGSAVNPKWTSYGALEIDIFAPSRQDFEVVMAAIAPLVQKLEFAKDLQEAPPYLSKERAIDEAVALFDAERFWEAHEVLESLWRVAEGSEKKLLQGLILVCAAFVHHQKGESKVAVGIARRALPLLAWTDPSYYVIDVGRVREETMKMVDEGTLYLFRI